MNFEQPRPRPGPCRGNRRSDASRTGTAHDDVSIGNQRQVSCRFGEDPGRGLVRRRFGYRCKKWCPDHSGHGCMKKGTAVRRRGIRSNRFHVEPALSRTHVSDQDISKAILMSVTTRWKSMVDQRGRTPGGRFFPTIDLPWRIAFAWRYRATLQRAHPRPMPLAHTFGGAQEYSRDRVAFRSSPDKMRGT